MSEARIGRRVPTHGLTMELEGLPPRRLLWYIGRPVVHELEVLNLSVTGAMLRGRRAPGLVSGAVRPLRFRGHRGVALILRTEAERDGRRRDPVRYAIEFLDIGPRMSEDISQLVGRQLHPEGDPTWHERHDE